MTKCPFSYGGRLTESILLGTISYRTGKKLTWNADNLCTDVPEANAVIKPAYRKGWEA